MSILSRFFGDPTVRILRSYKKDLDRVKVIEKEYSTTINSIDGVHAKTQEFRARFEPIRLAYITEKDRIDTDTSITIEAKNDLKTNNEKRYIADREALVQSLRFEAFALHRRACELIF